MPFFADGLYRSCLGPDENVAVFPYGHAGDSMLWQAESGFGFRLAGGYLYPLVLERAVADALRRRPGGRGR